MVNANNTQQNKKIEFVILLALTLITAYLFRHPTLANSLDFWAASLFYHPEVTGNSWFEQDNTIWIFFYYAAPWLSGILLLGSLAIFVGALFRQKLRAQRLSAAFVFLVVLLGSGFFINTLFKPHWGRPRPREVIELGGKLTYRPFYSADFNGQGKSFPCGHCSVGFSYGLFWWLLRRQKPTLGAISLGGSIIVGGFMGVGRIAAGGHFLSDVVWSALIVYWVCFSTYYFLLNIPRRELRVTPQNHEVDSNLQTQTRPLSKKPLQILLYSALGLAIVLTLLIASPFRQDYALSPSDPTLEPQKAINLRLQIERGQIQFKMDEGLSSPFSLKGASQGFAFPGSSIASACQKIQQETVCTVKQKGLFSDLETAIQITVNPRLIESLHLQVKEGDITRDTALPLPKNFELVVRP